MPGPKAGHLLFKDMLKRYFLRPHPRQRLELTAFHSRAHSLCAHGLDLGSFLGTNAIAANYSIMATSDCATLPALPVRKSAAQSACFGEAPTARQKERANRARGTSREAVVTRAGH
jgi:hypothetical protein